MKPKIKTISADRGVHIIDGLLLHFGDWFDRQDMTQEVKDLLSNINMVAHLTSQPSCIKAHQANIPKIRAMEKALIKNGFCEPLNRRNSKHKARMRKLGKEFQT